jgi:peptidoglycan-associated lipoprotein
MTQLRPALNRAVLVFASAALLVVAGCHKKPAPAPAPPPPPPPPAAKPTVTFSADPSTINKGQSAKLSWTTTDASNVSIAPEVGAVTPQGSTTVTPSDSTTYTITASGPGGSADATTRVTVSVPAPPPPPRVAGWRELFTEEVRDAYFDYDKANIRPDAQQALQKTAEFLKKYPEAKVVVEGHCDERGSTEYNLALGDRRAAAVKEYLINLGIPAANINTVSYGKEKPFCMESTEACWQQNRRGHFVPAN